MAMTNDAQRVAILEAEVQRLRSELAAVRPQPRVVKLDSPFAPPDIIQTAQLVRITLARFPMLHPDAVRLDPIPMDAYIPMVRSGLFIFRRWPECRRAR
jgi:hypothetical protein